MIPRCRKGTDSFPKSCWRRSVPSYVLLGSSCSSLPYKMSGWWSLECVFEEEFGIWFDLVSGARAASSRLQAFCSNRSWTWHLTRLYKTEIIVTWWPFASVREVQNRYHTTIIYRHTIVFGLGHTILFLFFEKSLGHMNFCSSDGEKNVTTMGYVLLYHDHGFGLSAGRFTHCEPKGDPAARDNFR